MTRWEFCFSARRA